MTPTRAMAWTHTALRIMTGFPPRYFVRLDPR